MKKQKERKLNSSKCLYNILIIVQELNELKEEILILILFLLKLKITKKKETVSTLYLISTFNDHRLLIKKK
jgi:hypothetical protein